MIQKWKIICLTFLFIQQTLVSQTNDSINFKAYRTTIAPIIDGQKDAIWENYPIIKGFKQKNPYYNAPPLFDTDVQILYDNTAIYVFAFCHDSKPDSILKQLGSRDNQNLNADYFIIAFDTYNKQQDAFIFGLSASGVQLDSRGGDDSYNVVWKSKTAITDSGWFAELKIPYSAIRFPNVSKQNWRFQCVRNIRRIREESRLIIEPRESNNELYYWPKLEGIENIEAPLRLSFTPYLSAGLQIESEKGTKKQTSKLFSGGLDLKYGINESYTLDLTLLPDFSQVQSDNKYKNLTAYETVYSEQRPFFKESVELFNKGDIFYSRRIGRLPKSFYTIPLDSNQIIIKNPQQTQLINALKISGRNSRGLAIGILNAITDNTYAHVKDTLTKSEKNILTEPFANYNVFVIDQAFNQGNNLYLTNTSFLRNKTNYSSNVTAIGFTLINKSKTYQLSINSAMSHFYFIQNNYSELPDNGYKSSINIDKINGNFKYGLSTSYMDKNFNANDVGLTISNNYLNNNAYINYNQYKPTKHFLNYGLNLNYIQNYHLSGMNISTSGIELNFWSTTHRYLSIWGGGYIDTYNGFDYYEPRKEGYFLRTGYNKNISFGISTDYRKTLAFDVFTNVNHNTTFNASHYYVKVSPLARVSNHLSFRYTIESSYSKNNIGYASIDNLSGVPLMGKRNITTIINLLSANYLFKNDLSINLKFRYYWSQGEYLTIYTLTDGGTLTDNTNEKNPLLYNFNFNSLNADIVFSWQFAPGSNLMIIWKNEIFKDSPYLNASYFDNFKNLGEYPQNNTILIKMLYYLDYEYLFKKKT